MTDQRELLTHPAVPPRWKAELERSIASGIVGKDLDEALARLEKRIADTDVKDYVPVR